MTCELAIKRIQSRTSFLNSRIAEVEAAGKSAYWFRLDVEANDLAVEALRYLDAMQQYEQSQKFDSETSPTIG